MVNRVLSLLAVASIAAVVGFFLGKFIQHRQAGYFYDVRTESSYDSPYGPIKLKYVTETVGWPFLDPGTCTIVLEDQSGIELTLYKARRVFQESSPYFETIDVAGNSVSWDDGCYEYDLTIRRSLRDTSNHGIEPASTINGTLVQPRSNLVAGETEKTAGPSPEGL